MARYEETSGASSLLIHMAPWLAAGHYHGKEAQMARYVSSVYGRHLGKLPKATLASLHGKPEQWLLKRMSAGKMKGALNIAKTRGVFRASAWGAAKRAGLMAPLAKIAASRAAGAFFTGFNILMFAPLIYSGVRGAVNTIHDIGRTGRRLDFGGDYIDTRGAYTERQRSLRAITSSRMSTRAAIGNEALLMHR